MSDCDCKAENIMAEAKKTTKDTAKKSTPVATMRRALDQMIEAHETAADERGTDTHQARRQCIVKADTVIKFIEARWPGDKR